MPNWNMNTMDVKGQGENVKNVLRFIEENFSTEKVQDQPKEYIYILNFEKYAPTPLNEKGEIIDEWYDWRLENWGCKWSPCSDQYIYLTVKFKNEHEEHYDNGGFTRLKGEEEKFEFKEDNIIKLKDRIDEIQELMLELSFDTPWGPPVNIMNKWFKDYEYIDIMNKYYEGGCAFAGKYGIENGELVDDYYDSSKMDDYIGFLLDEDLESLDWYIDLTHDLFMDMYLDDKGREFVDKLHDKVREQLVNEKYNFNRGKLISEILDKYNTIMSEKREKEKEQCEVQPHVKEGE